MEWIVGKDIANPLALLLAACLMGDHVNRKPMADRIRHAIDRVIRDDGLRTSDLGGKAKTKDFTYAVIKRVKRDV